MAINKTQINVLEKVPLLFQRQILNLVTKHNTYLMNKGFINNRPKTEFEELITTVNANTLERIINIIIKKNYDLYIDSFSPKELFDSPKLMDYILEKEISNLEYLEEDKVTDYHISLLAKKDTTIIYLINKDKLPLKALKDPKILKTVLQEVSFEKYLEILEILENNYPELLSTAIEIGAKKGIFDEYHFSMEKYLNNEDVLKAIKRININDILDIYQTKPDLATKVFLAFIKDSKIYGLYEKENPKDLSFFDSSEILHALAEAPNLYELDTFLTEIDVVNFSIKDIINIINRLKNSLFMHYPKDFFNNYLCLKLSIENKKDSAFVGFTESTVRRYLSETTNYQDLKDNFEDLLYYIANGDLKPVENVRLLADYIHLLNEKKCKNSDYFDIFTLSSFTQDNIDKYIEFINNIDELPLLPDQLLKDRNFFTSLLEKCTNPAIIIQAKIDDISDEELDIIVDKIKNSNIKYYVISKSLSNNLKFLMKLLEKDVLNSDILSIMNKDLYTNEVINEIYQKNDIRIFEKLKGVSISDISRIIEVDSNDINHVMELPDNDDTLVRCLMLLSKIKTNKKQLEGIEIKSKRIFLSKGLPEREVNLYLHDIKKGTKDPLTAPYIKSKKNLLFALYISDYYYDYNIDYIDSIPSVIIERINSKHLREIIKILGKGKQNTIRLALNIYLSIGYERAINLLSSDPKKNYGNPSINRIISIFNNIDINTITFKNEGNGFVPELNEEWIELIFGKNNRVKNTPIRNFLNDYEDKKEEIDKNNMDIDSNEKLSKEEKERIKNKNKLLFEKYKQNNDYFMSNASNIFNNWDSIKEEYLRAQNNSKLKIKMNPSKIVEILNSFNALKKINYDEIEDEELLKSDVLDYVGKDNQFIIQPALVPSRILELSREMNDVKTKKFPNIRISKGDYILKTYNPQDRSILSTGFKYGCCFRPNANADNKIDEYRNTVNTLEGHSESSLLRYCTSTEYGGCIEIIDLTGAPVLFSPILRSGNVLIIHGIEAKEELLPIHFELINKYANRVIEESIKNNDNIDCVLIGIPNNKYRNEFQKQIPSSKKFKYYNVSEEFDDMYNNCDMNDQLIVAIRKGKNIEDIHYGEVEASYSYPSNYHDHSLVIEESLLRLCQELDSLDKQYITLGNKRFIAKENNNDHNSYELLTQMKKLKKQYLSKYNELLKRVKGMDYYKKIKNIIRIISSIDGEITLNGLKEYKEIYYGKDWYIAITINKEIVCNAKSTGLNAMRLKLEELKKLTKYEVREKKTMVA